MSSFIENQAFSNIEHGASPLEFGTYEDCRFDSCNLNHADLTNFKFIECEFESCDLSMAVLMGTSFQNVRFNNCKLMGLHFEDCSDILFAIDCKDSKIDFSFFEGMKSKDVRFRNCSLLEVDFTSANIQGASFTGCDLTGARFEQTVIERADFRAATNFDIDPTDNYLRKARFDSENLSGLLTKFELDIN